MFLVVVLRLNFAINVAQVGYTLMNAIETQYSRIASVLSRREHSSKYGKGRLRVLGQGARLLLRVHLCICMLLHGGRFRSVSSFPEQQWLVY